jgi:hypothetical protein
MALVHMYINSASEKLAPYSIHSTSLASVSDMKMVLGCIYEKII